MKLPRCPPSSINLDLDAPVAFGLRGRCTVRLRDHGLRFTFPSHKITWVIQVHVLVRYGLGLFIIRHQATIYYIIIQQFRIIHNIIHTYTHKFNFTNLKS
jgi:hypothetical protein